MEFVIFFSIILIVVGFFNMHYIIKKGWGAVVNIFPGYNNPTGEVINFAYMWIGKGVYKNSIKVTISPEGLNLDTYFIAKILHKPILIPWDKIYLKKAANFLTIKRYYLTIGEPAITDIIIYEKLFSSLKPHLVNIV